MIFPVNNTDNIKTSIFYINDYHGKSINMERTVTASKEFDIKYNKQPDVDTFKLSSGDIMLGEDFKTNKIAVLFQQFIGIKASAIGNHEYDMQEQVSKILPLVPFKLLATNVNFAPSNPFKQVTTTSTIEEKNGHKYGIIGTSPIDLHKRSKIGVIDREIKVSNARQTVEDIQNEVNKLQKQGINKIILLSHLGFNMDKIVAKQTQGIDVILGGHSHDLLIGLIENKNLLRSKSGEPVIITQAGRDGKNFGILNLEFDKNGVIQKAQNNIGYTRSFKRNPTTKYVFDKIFGQKEVYGYVKSAPPPLTKDLIEPNPHAYFIADCVRKDMNCDIAIVPSPNVRGYFESGKIDSRILADILPFKNKIYTMNYTEKELVDALKKACQSFTNIANKPGIFYFSGMRYTVNTSGKLIALSYVDKLGKETKIDINNPREDKFYKTAINDFCASGNDGFSMLNHPDRILDRADFDATKCVRTVLLREKQPVEIFDDGRLLIIPA